MSAACPFCVTWISLSLFSICPDPRNREDHKLLLRPNSCLNPSVSSAAEEVPESDPNHHPSISVISVCLTSAVCWFKSDQFYEKKLLERPTSSFAIESTSWANQQRWWSLHWEFENPPCNFNVAKTNAILRISLFTMNSRIKETNTVLRFEKGPSLEKKKHEWLSWKSVISSASQSSQIHYHCASRGNAVPVSRTPPESESHARARVTPESQHFWNDALSPASQLRSKMRWCQQHHQNLLGGKPTTPQGMQKPFPWILETCEKHVFLLSLRLTEKIVADSPSLRLCVLVGCWKIALLRLPKVQLWDKICDLASMDSSDVKRLPSWNILLRKLSM